MIRTLKNGSERIRHNRLRKLMDIISLYKNWYTVLLNRIGLVDINTVKLRNGLRFKIRNSEDRSIINEIFSRKVYTIFHEIKINDTVIDIGASIGTFSIFATTSAENVKVFAYEPFKGGFDVMRDNIKINNLTRNIFPFELGVCGSSGRRLLHISDELPGWNSIFVDDSVSEVLNKTCMIDTITLRDVFLLNKIKYCDFLKLDCEGCEFEILFRAPKEILSRIGYIAMEYHDVYGNHKNLIKFLKKNNFNVEHVARSQVSGYIYAKKR